MNKDLSCTIVPYFQVQEGKLEAFKAITAKMVEQTETEPKCLYYSFYFDGDTVFCREAYDGAEGILEHLERIGPLLDKALSISEITFLEVHGPSEELAKLKAPLAELSPRYFELGDGFKK